MSERELTERKRNEAKQRNDTVTFEKSDFAKMSDCGPTLAREKLL